MGVVAIPDFAFATKTSRDILPVQVTFQDASFNVGRLPCWLQPCSRRPESLGVAMEDRLHQSLRSSYIPGFKNSGRSQTGGRTGSNAERGRTYGNCFCRFKPGSNSQGYGRYFSPERCKEQSPGFKAKPHWCKSPGNKIDFVIILDCRCRLTAVVRRQKEGDF